MIEEVKYDVDTKIRTKVHYQNYPRNEVDAVIIEVVCSKERGIQYKIFIPVDGRYDGEEVAVGYINQEDILFVIGQASSLDGR